jgi:hypothetical protein
MKAWSRPFREGMSSSPALRDFCLWHIGDVAHAAKWAAIGWEADFVAVTGLAQLSEIAP